MPDLGIGEAIAGLLGGGGDVLAGLFGGGEAAAGGAAADTAGLVGGAADAAATGAGVTGSIADLAGTTGASAFLDPAAAAAGSAGLAGGPSVAGTIADTVGPTAAAGAGGTLATGLGAGMDSSVFSTGTTPAINSSGMSSAVGGAGGAMPSSPISSLMGANASAPGGASSVFNTGTSAVPGVSSTGAPAPVVPGGGGAAGSAAPAGVTAPTDATAAAGGAAPAAGGTTAAQPSSIQQLLSKAGGGALDSLTKNPLGIALGAGGLGYNILQGQKQTANQNALTADAKTATANSNALVGQGEALQQYLTSGTLPPQYMTQVQQAISDAKTTAISNAAANGQPTDPKLNTALATELAKIDASEPGMISQVAATLASSGQGLISAGQGAAGLSGSLYQTLVQNDTAQAANTGKAIATLAAALNGKSSNTVGGTNISVSQG
jgi:hypothetical protein